MQQAGLRQQSLFLHESRPPLLAQHLLYVRWCARPLWLVGQDGRLPIVLSQTRINKQSIPQRITTRMLVRRVDNNARGFIYDQHVMIEVKYGNVIM
jgi:hypothetical protein